MLFDDSKSAIVLATLSIRKYDFAEIFNLAGEALRSSSASVSTTLYFLISAFSLLALT